MTVTIDPVFSHTPADAADPAVRLRLLADAEVAALQSDVLAGLEATGPGRADAALAALSTAPTAWSLAGRSAEAVRFGGGRPVLVAGGPAQRFMAVDEAAVESAVDAAAVEAFCRVADALPGVSVVEPPAISDVAGPPAAGRLLGVATALAATGKHILTVALSGVEARVVIDLAALVAGGMEALRASPLVTLGAPPTAVLDVAATAAEAGVPCLISLSPRDRTAAGIADSVAAGLAAAARVQERVPGAVVGFALPPISRPPLDDSYLGALAALAQLSHSFGLPLLATALATNANGPGWLAGIENTAAALVGYLAGLDGLAGAGLLRGAVLSPVELALDAEIVSYAAATQAGVPVDDETLAVEVIEKVGIAGNYLGERHTRRHMRDVWRPRFFDRTPHEQWLHEGRRQSVELAADFVRATLAEHTVEPLDAALAEQLLTMARRAGKEIR